jgi:hypothetical protein
MSVPVIIIIGGPRPGNLTTAPVTSGDRHEFTSVADAIAFLESQHRPDVDKLPAGDGTSES